MFMIRMLLVGGLITGHHYCLPAAAKKEETPAKEKIQLILQNAFSEQIAYQITEGLDPSTIQGTVKGNTTTFVALPNQAQWRYYKLMILGGGSTDTTTLNKLINKYSLEVTIQPVPKIMVK